MDVRLSNLWLKFCCTDHAKKCSSICTTLGRNLLWVDAYQPNLPEQVCGNKDSVKYLSDWLQNWKIRCTSVAACSEVDMLHKSVANGENCDEDKVWSEEDSDSDENTSTVYALPNVLVLTGPVGRLSFVEEKLKKSLDSENPVMIDEIISSFSEKPHYKEDSILHRLEDVNHCFSKQTMEDILEALELQHEETNDDWYLTTAETLRKASPMSLKITLQSIRAGRRQTFYECLMQEYRLTVRCLLGKMSNDFYEGCRAILIDKDRTPKWNPAMLGSITPDMVDHYFAPFEKSSEELQLPGAYRQQTSVKMVHPRL